MTVEDRHAGWRAGPATYDMPASRAGEKRKTRPIAIALVVALLAALVLVTVVHGVVLLFGQPIVDMRL